MAITEVQYIEGEFMGIPTFLNEPFLSDNADIFLQIAIITVDINTQEQY